MNYRLTRNPHAWLCAAAWTFVCGASITSVLTLAGAA